LKCKIENNQIQKKKGRKQMPFTTHAGIRIHYEIEGQGRPLVLQHSFTRSLETWRDFGYVQELSKDYQLILVDARGHGESDKPHDVEAYQPECMVGDILAVMDHAGIKQAFYWGYSMGAMLGWQIGKTVPGRFDALILGGAGPYPFTRRAIPPDVPQLRTYVELAVEQGTEAMVAFKEKMGGPMSPIQRQRELAVDPRALLAWLNACENWLVEEELLPGIQLPCLVYAGEADLEFAGARKAAGLLPHGIFLPLPGLDHFQSLVHSDLVLPFVKKFLAGLPEKREHP
jgi:pimeloyl-ACP methyl ester carboxylesterase